LGKGLGDWEKCLRMRIEGLGLKDQGFNLGMGMRVQGSEFRV
jgi:hypothetical protein